MEKNLSLNYDEASALLEMSLFTYLEADGDAAESALGKLSDLCREFSEDKDHIERLPVCREFACGG